MQRFVLFLASGLLLVQSLSILSPAAAADGVPRLPGPFRAQALGFYFVHPGGPLRLTLEAKADAGPAADARILCRFFDHEEQLVKWQCQRLEPGTATVWEQDYGAEAPVGIYQVRYAGSNISVDVKAVPERAFGLAASRCMISLTQPQQFASAWLLLPPGTGEWRVNGVGVTGAVADGAGRQLAVLGPKPAVLDNAREAQELVRLEITSSRAGDYYRFGFNGVDAILCPDPATARAIGGSLEQAPDGRRFPHRFQLRMHEWSRGLTREDLAVEIVPLTAREEAWLAHPHDASALLGGWGLFTHINFLLRDQNLDPASPEFGRFNIRRANPGALAAVYALDRPYNPYYRHPGIANRLLLNVYQDLLELRENETWHDGDNAYCGGDALGIASRFNALSLGARAIADEKLRALWVDGLRRITDRFPFFRASCDNQSSHWPLAYWELYEVTRDEGYQRLAHDYIAGLSLPENNSFMKTGYQQEAYGPDATYQGLGASLQAVYYRKSGDPHARAGLQTIYRFFNHTVAPEPDGTVFGASGFSHRTAGSWVNRQYGGGLTYMAGELPEAALWATPDWNGVPLTPEAIRAGLKNIPPDSTYEGTPQVLGYTTHVIGPFYRQFLYPATPTAAAVFPARETAPFTRNFNDEFLAVRRDGYYFLGYLRGTADGWTRSQRRLKPDNPSPNYKWNCLPGPQLFWTPGYGSLFTSMNWNADTLLMLRADLADGTCSFPDYWSTQSRHLADQEQVSTTQTMVNLPLTVERRLKFREQQLEQTLVVTAGKELAVEALYEQLPLLLTKPGFVVQFRCAGQWQADPGLADAFWCGNQAGDGVWVTLTPAVPVTLGEISKLGSQQVRPLRLMLPAKLAAGSVTTLSLVFEPRRRDNRR